MTPLTITATCTGDMITAVSELSKMVKAYGKPIYLEFPEGFRISVKPTSDVQDLIQMVMLEHKLIKATKS